MYNVATAVVAVIVVIDDLVIIVLLLKTSSRFLIVCLLLNISYGVKTLSLVRLYIVFIVLELLTLKTHNWSKKMRYCWRWCTGSNIAG